MLSGGWSVEHLRDTYLLRLSRRTLPDHGPIIAMKSLGHQREHETARSRWLLGTIAPIRCLSAIHPRRCPPALSLVGRCSSLGQVVGGKPGYALAANLLVSVTTGTNSICQLLPSTPWKYEKSISPIVPALRHN